jgi:hypothetical protein
VFRSCELCGGLDVEHPQEHLVAGGLAVCVDRQLMPLLRTCWSLGLLTYASCEDYLWSGRALLEFLNAESAQDFLSRVLQGVDTALRRRVLEGTADDGWSVQASLRELRVDGVEPLLRLGMQVLVPAEDVPLALEALLRPRPDELGEEEDEEDPHAVYDAKDLDEIVLDVVLREDVAGFDYLAERVSADVVASLLEQFGASLSFLPYRSDVPPLAQLALTALTRNEETLLDWEEMDVQGYRDHLRRFASWWTRTAQHWPALKQIEEYRPFEGGRELVDAAGEMKLDLGNHAPGVRSSMATGSVDDVLEDLWLLQDQAAALGPGLDWLEVHGCFPHKDPRSPVHRRGQLARAREERLALPDPAQALREALLAEAWPGAVAVTYQPDGRHVLLRDIDAADDGRPATVSEGTREELADLAHDALQLPPTINGWACRMSLGDKRRPVHRVPRVRRRVAVGGRGGPRVRRCRQAARQPLRVAGDRRARGRHGRRGPADAGFPSSAVRTESRAGRRPRRSWAAIPRAGSRTTSRTTR